MFYATKNLLNTSNINDLRGINSIYFHVNKISNNSVLFTQ